MTQQWGRPSDAGSWPRPKHLWTIGVLALAVLSGAGVTAYQHTHTWTPLQRVYLSAYLRTYLLAGLGTSDGRYRLLYVVDRKGQRLAFNGDVQPATTASGEDTVTLSDIAREAGVRGLKWVSGRFRHNTVQEVLRIGIYDDRSLLDLARPALWSACVVLLAGLLVAVPKDSARVRARRHGQRLKGPELVPIRQFNRRLRADGVGFVQTDHALQRFMAWQPLVRIPRRLESSHVLIMGDTGTGKSSLIRQLLHQIDARGEAAIVYDPAREYTSHFFRPERGDVILNPLDARCPYWKPGDELRDPAEALTLATSLFPDRPHEHQNKFFTDATRRVFAHLLTFKPSAEELALWLCGGEEFDRRVRGTSYATMVDPVAPEQRIGVLASLNMVADLLKLLPSEREATGRWSALDWAQTGRGWLFFTNTPETRDSLIPLISLWLDMLVLRLMSREPSAASPVWFVLDELASLQHLPQLHTAVTENRKSNSPMVLGFQGRSQLESLYGHKAEAMLSQPATKIFLRTSEPRSARWIADTIGEIEIERLRESRSSGRDRQQSYALERHVEPLVMASEIEGLASLHGYLKVQNLVVQLDVPYTKPLVFEPKFIPRPRRAGPVVAPSIEAEAVEASGPPATPAAVSQPRAESATAAQGRHPFFE